MNQALRRELAQEINAEHYDLSEDGVYFPRQGVMASGEYFDRINGGDWSRTKNRIVTEGLAHILSVALGKTPKPSDYYLALFSGSASPADTWTAANFATVASEVVSLTQGYTSATRPVWTPPTSTASGSIDNLSSVASVTIAATGSLTVTGAAMLTSPTRGGSSTS